jgi:sporulation protein YqfC
VSNFRAEIENHHGLIEFSDELIGVKGHDGIAMVRGQKLELEAMSDSRMLISGQISGVDIEVM